MCLPDPVNVILVKTHTHTFRDRALQARVEAITTEECEQFTLPSEALVISIEVAHRLKPRRASNRFSRASFDMVDIVEVEEP